MAPVVRGNNVALDAIADMIGPLEGLAFAEDDEVYETLCLKGGRIFSDAGELQANPIRGELVPIESGNWLTVQGTAPMLGPMRGELIASDAEEIAGPASSLIVDGIALMLGPMAGQVTASDAEEDLVRGVTMVVNGIAMMLGPMLGKAIASDNPDIAVAPLQGGQIRIVDELQANRIRAE